MQEALIDLIKPSIFDSDARVNQTVNSSLWESSSAVSSEILFSGKLAHSDDYKLMIELTVDLYEDRLEAYCNETRDQLFGIISLINCVNFEYSEVEKQEDNEVQFLFFQRDSHFTILFSSSIQEFQKWIAHLKPLCILSNFFSEYKFEKIIGKGAYGKVIQCSRISDNAKFAVKVFKKPNDSKKKNYYEDITTIRNEIKILRQINHPNIIKMHEVYEGQNHVYAVLELCTGGELFKKLYQEIDFTETMAQTLMKNLLQALEYLNAKNLMHRDIKPENLLIRNQQGSITDIVLTDFGLSESSEKENYFLLRCGTPGYVAPEILANRPYGTQVDVFSAGVIMYIVLTGLSPFFGSTYMEILERNSRCNIDFNFKELQRELSKDSIDLMKQMLKKNPEERITIQEALNHPWFKKENDSLLTKFHQKTMQKLSKQQQKKLVQTQQQTLKINKNYKFIMDKQIKKQNSSSSSGSSSSNRNGDFSVQSPTKSKFGYLKV